MLSLLHSWNPACGDTINSVAYYINLLQSSIGEELRRRTSPTTGRTFCRRRCTAERPVCKVVNATANARDPIEGWGCAQPDCTDAAPYCSESSLTGVRARQICPVTCGCDQP